MIKDWKITYFKPDRPGIFYKEKSICFATEVNGKECGLIIYDENGTENRFPFDASETNGTLAGIELSCNEPHRILYNYYTDGLVWTDPYAPAIKGLEIWGDTLHAPRKTIGCICPKEYNWQGDTVLRIPYENSILYGLDVRSYTMHKSAGVKNNGTFEGLVEKIPYLKSLGITAVELLPCYEYEECMQNEDQLPEYAIPKEDSQLKSKKDMRLNCWGFQKGFYFAPKSSYSAIGNPSLSFKNMVHKMHMNGIEVLLHIYFPPELKALYILDVLKYWVKEYHVDGFRLSGVNLPYRILTEDAVLKYTKLRFAYLPEEEGRAAGIPMKNLSVDNVGFFVDMRRYLKGDEGMIGNVISNHRCNPKTYGSINFLTDYNSFSLYDMVSYESKHNEANAEANKDGCDQNYSWNCGTEGETRKKAILQLRIRQMKNALAMICLSQGTPYLFGGDEFANTRFGNNNPYCQDNEIGWIKWKETKVSKEILSYTKALISFRKKHKILHMSKEFKGMDSKGCGIPDVSYHGVEAWRPDLGHISRMLGIMLCGLYADEEDSLYIGFNMHWEPHEIALPKLPKDMGWLKVCNTCDEISFAEDRMIQDDFTVQVDSRSIVVYRTQKITSLPKNNAVKQLKKK